MSEIKNDMLNPDMSHNKQENSLSMNDPLKTEFKTSEDQEEDQEGEEGDQETKSFGKIDVLLADVFHIGDESIRRVPWGKLSVESRVQKLTEYFDNEFNNDNTEKTISKTTINMLINMADKGQLHLKKQVSYDEINQRVIKILVLTKEPHTENYIYKPEKMSRRDKSRKSARSRLFRKKR